MQASILEGLEPEKAADIVEEMAPDEAADILSELEAGASEEILEEMEQEAAQRTTAIPEEEEKEEVLQPTVIPEVQPTVIIPEEEATVIPEEEEEVAPQPTVILEEKVRNASRQSMFPEGESGRERGGDSSATTFGSFSEEHYCTPRGDECARDQAVSSSHATSHVPNR